VPADTGAVNARRSVMLVAGALAAVVAATAGAFACTSLATLALSSSSGPAGSRVTATGTGYAVGPPVLPVVLRWNSTDGPELARVAPDPAGRISVAVTVPSVPPGYYVIVAVHRDDKGVDRYGTPSRASFQVIGPAKSPAVALALPARPVAERSDALPAPAVAVAVVLLLGTAAALGRQAVGR